MHPQNDMLFFCRRRAPTLIRGDRAVWPVTAEDDWCGEYKKASDV